MQDSGAGSELMIDPKLEELVRGSSQQTAKMALEILEKLEDPDYLYKTPSANERRALLRVFAGKGKVLYGKAFDMVRINKETIQVGEMTEEWIEAHFKAITIAEVKATKQKKIKPDFRGYFFGLTAGELLVAQSLAKQYIFLFVNIHTPNAVPLALSLQEVYGTAKSVYPTWSIRF